MSMVAALLVTSLLQQAATSPEDPGARDDVSIPTTVKFEAKLFAEPDLDAEVLAVVPVGATVRLLDDAGKPWVKVAHEDETGYLTEGHLDPSESAWTEWLGRSRAEREARVDAATMGPGSYKVVRESPGRLGEIVAPVVLRIVPPEYPEALAESGIEGDVVVEVIVRKDGSATPVEVVRGLHPELDEKALEAAGRWEFQPAWKDGEPVDAVAEIVVTFHLLK